MKRKHIKLNTTIAIVVVSMILIRLLASMFLFFPKDEKPKIEKIFSKDTTPPVIENVHDITIYEGDEIDLLKEVTITDDSIRVNSYVDGDYDFNKAGTYNLKYIAIDTRRNTSESSFVLTVLPKEEVIDGMTYIKGIPIINKTYKVDKSFVPKDLVKVGSTQMVKEAADAFFELQKGAKEENINIFSMTGYRSVSFQTSIYNGYLKNDTKENVDTYSARPGYSEHHSGLAVDVNSLKGSWGSTEEGIWLNNNAYKYGFIIRYPKDKENLTGYMYEPWHIRYVGKELAEELYNNGNWITLEEYLNITSNYEK